MTGSALIGMLIATYIFWLEAPRQARRLTVRAPAALRPSNEPASIALEAELCARLRLSAAGGAVGAVLAAVPLLLRDAMGEGPDGLTAVATVLSSTVVTAVVVEAFVVLRRAPRPNNRPRTAALTPRASLDGRTETVAELFLATGALVVIAACVAVRRTFVRHPVAATTSDELVIHAAAAAVTRDRFSENLVASGGVLTLAALLGPISAGGDTGLIVAISLVAITLAVMAVLVTTRRIRRTSVPT